MVGIAAAPRVPHNLHEGLCVTCLTDLINPVNPVPCCQQMNMLELAKEVQKEQELHDVGGDEATLATVPGAVRVRCQSRNSGYQVVPSPRCHAGHTIAACGSTFLTCQRADILYDALLQRAVTPMKDLRPDAPKEQMRMHEQDALPLVRPA